MRTDLFTVGAERRLGGGWRVAGEVIRIVQHDTTFGFDDTAGYLSIYRRLGGFTPYLTLSVNRTGRATSDWQQRLENTRLPASVAGAATLNGAMSVNAHELLVFTQNSGAVGSSYALDRRTKLKAEWLHTRATQSSLIDVPSGEFVRQVRHVNVLSLAYCFTY
jgi:hypothetical protein